MENNNHLQTSNLHAEEWQVLFKLVTNGAKLKNVAVVTLILRGFREGLLSVA